MLVTFEYMKKMYNNGVAETFLITLKGKKRKNYIASFLVMTTFAIIISVFMLIIVINEFLFYKVSDPNREYISHIVKNIFLNSFLVMELAIVIGITLSIIKKRIVSYVIMTVFILATCPFATKIASLIMESSLNSWKPGRVAFQIISHFYIVPRFNIDYLPEAAFGESLLPDRFFIIFFWMFLFLFFICITRKIKKIHVIMICLSLIMLIAFHLPIARMNYGMDIYYGGDPEWMNIGNNSNLKEDGGFEITKYDMNMSLNINLRAKVSMDVSKSLDEYKMTLYKDYKVHSVKDQNGNKLKFSQKGNYLNIKNSSKNNISKIIVDYAGNNMTYYANYQCCFLPGYYLYYPRAGYIPVIDNTYGYIYYNFVNEETEFNVKIDHPERYISNLELDNGEFKGKCDGFTLLKGFYKKKELGNGNTLVYPYLDNFIVHDGKMSEEECWKEVFEISIPELEKDDVKDTMLFFDNALSIDQGWAYGKNQIFIQSEPPFYLSLN
ncbi:MAG: hypothetical protein E7254_01880 [Lachnospiraceae bacterium]|nr:hypothetical protein [Lachnospiraceae bacterium]